MINIYTGTILPLKIDKILDKITSFTNDVEDEIESV